MGKKSDKAADALRRAELAKSYGKGVRIADWGSLPEKVKEHYRNK